jgi:HK97 gp10 family phage protein
VNIRLDIDNEAAAKVAEASVRQAVDSAVRAGVEMAKALAPVRTGALRNSIRRLDEEAGVDSLKVWYGSDLSYALAVEAGTARRPGRQYLAQSMTAVTQELTRGL